MVEGNWGHHLNVVPYLGKILIRGLRGIKCQKLGFFDIFSRTTSNFCMMVENKRAHHLRVVPYLRKILIRGLGGIKCQKLGFLDILTETGHYKFLIFCMMVECNRGHHLSVVPYLEKILIWGLRGIKCQKFRFLGIVSETTHQKFLLF